MKESETLKIIENKELKLNNVLQKYAKAVERLSLINLRIRKLKEELTNIGGLERKNREEKREK